MACPICGGAGDKYVCTNEACEAFEVPFACDHCAEVYDWVCPECEAPLMDVEYFGEGFTTEEPIAERDGM